MLELAILSFLKGHFFPRRNQEKPVADQGLVVMNLRAAAAGERIANNRAEHLASTAQPEIRLRSVDGAYEIRVA